MAARERRHALGGGAAAAQRRYRIPLLPAGLMPITARMRITARLGVAAVCGRTCYTEW